MGPGNLILRCDDCKVESEVSLLTVFSEDHGQQLWESSVFMRLAPLVRSGYETRSQHIQIIHQTYIIDQEGENSDELLK